MKLAEALSERKRLREEIRLLANDLTSRLFREEGEEEVDVSSDWATLEKLRDEVRMLTIRINRTNNEAFLASGESIMEGIARRDMLTERKNDLDTVIQQLQPVRYMGYGRRSKDDVKFVPNMDREALQTQRTALASGLRELDLELQEANWTVDVVA